MEPDFQSHLHLDLYFDACGAANQLSANAQESHVQGDHKRALNLKIQAQFAGLIAESMRPTKEEVPNR